MPLIWASLTIKSYKNPTWTDDWFDQKFVTIISDREFFKTTFL